MPLVYRTTGAWGAGVGRALTPQEIDANFKYINDRIAAIASPRPAVVDTIVGSANDIVTLTLEDATEHALTMPSSPYRYMGDWLDSAEYERYNVVSVEKIMYLVMHDHVSGLSFSAGAVNSTGQSLYRLLSLDETTPAGIVDLTDNPTGTETVFTPVLADANKTFAFEFYYDAPFLDIPPESSVDFPIGTKIGIFSWGDLDVEVTFPTGVTVNTKTDGNFKSNGIGSSMTLVKVGADEWDLNGDTGTTP